MMANAILERISDGLVTLDREWRYTYANAKAGELIRRNPQDLVGKHIWTEFPHNVGRPLQRACERAMAGQVMVRLEGYSPTYGRWFEYRIYPSPDGLTIYFGDVTERRTAHDRLREHAAALRSLTERLQGVREEEGKRIARELHDELGQSLTGLRIDLSWIDKRLAAEASTDAMAELRQRVASMTRQLDQTVRTVRRIATDLRPMVLDDFGLAAAIEWQLQEFHSRTGIGCTVRLPPDDITIAPDRATAVFRILTESLTNVVRHAGATRVEVGLSVERGELRLEVADDGRGMPQGTAGGRRSLGILGMEERARALSGTVAFTPRPGGGTVVTLRVPWV